MQTEARLTRSRAKQTDTPLTAPLPYTSSKGGREERARDTELPRAVLFDVTNEDKTAGTQAGLEESKLQKKDVATASKSHGIEGNNKEQPSEGSFPDADAPVKTLNKETKGAQACGPVLEERGPAIDPDSSAKLQSGVDLEAMQASSADSASFPQPSNAAGQATPAPQMNRGQQLQTNPCPETLFAPPASTYQMQHIDWTMRKPLRPDQTPAQRQPPVSEAGPKTEAVQVGEDLKPFGSPDVTFKEVKTPEPLDDPAVSPVSLQHWGLEEEKEAAALKDPSHKKEAAIAKLDAMHQEQIADRWAMPGDRSPLELPMKAAVEGDPRLQSRVVKPEDFDPRSLRQLRKAVKARKEEKMKPAESCTSSECTTTAYIPGKEEEEVVSKLSAAISGMDIKDHAASPEPLRGLPVREGTHIRFDDEGEPIEVEHKMQLRGVPLAKGHHTRF